MKRSLSMPALQESIINGNELHIVNDGKAIRAS